MPSKRPILIKRMIRKRSTVAQAHKQAAFAHEYVRLRENGKSHTQALIASAQSLGHKGESNAAKQGGVLYNSAKAQAIIAEATKRHTERAEVNSETILRYWWDVATCEIPIPDACACRYCWGQDNQYQFTLDEYRQKLRQHTADQLKLSPHKRRPFDELGGIGFDRTKKPNPECNECNGLGRNYTLVVDRNRLTPAQRMAIDEIRIAKDGSVSLKMRNRDRAMENLQSLMGMIQPRKPLEVLDPTRPLEENVDVLLQSAIDQGLLNIPQLALPVPVEPDDDGSSAELAVAAAG